MGENLTYLPFPLMSCLALKSNFSSASKKKNGRSNSTWKEDPTDIRNR